MVFHNIGSDIVQLDAKPERGSVRMCLAIHHLCWIRDRDSKYARHKCDFSFSILITSAKLTVLEIPASRAEASALRKEDKPQDVFIKW
jgi:hypothetical protein